MQNDCEMPYPKKMKIWVKTHRYGPRDHFGEFWNPLHISPNIETRNSKFGKQIDREVPYRKKIWVKSGCQGLLTIFENFETPPYLGNG